MARRDTFCEGCEGCVKPCKIALNRLVDKFLEEHTDLMEALKKLEERDDNE